jgi:hypothetical protein
MPLVSQGCTSLLLKCLISTTIAREDERGSSFTSFVLQVTMTPLVTPRPQSSSTSANKATPTSVATSIMPLTSSSSNIEGKCGGGRQLQEEEDEEGGEEPAATAARKEGGTGNASLPTVTVSQPVQWVVERRYSDFRRFHKALKKRQPNLASLPFPPKSYLFRLNKMTIQYRQTAFQRYLALLISIDPRPAELEDFLELPPHRRGGGGGGHGGGDGGGYGSPSISTNDGGTFFVHHNQSGAPRDMQTSYVRPSKRNSSIEASYIRGRSLNTNRISSFEDVHRGYIVNPDIG